MRRGVPIRSAEARRLVNRGPAWREHPAYYRDEPPEDFRCAVCGWMRDTPEHELGCEAAVSENKQTGGGS